MNHWGRYEVEPAPRHSGYFSQVFYGRDPVQGRPVAIKRLAGGAAARREADVMARCGRHPNLPRLYDRFDLNGWSCIVMELAPGRPLEALTGRRLRPGRVVHITLDVLAGLDRLHRRGFLHGDVQPGNIMFRQNPWSVKLVDFGTAVAKGRGGLRRGRPAGGTWEFMPPEQFRRNCLLDDSCDLYAAAGICVSLLTGGPPFGPTASKAGNAARGCRRACRRTKWQPPAWNLGHRPLEDVLRRALSPRRKDRFPTATGFAAALQAALETTVSRDCKRR